MCIYVVQSYSLRVILFNDVAPSLMDQTAGSRLCAPLAVGNTLDDLSLSIPRLIVIRIRSSAKLFVHAG